MTVFGSILAIYPSVSPVCLFILPSVRPAIYLSTYPSVRPAIYLSTCLFVRPSNYLSFYLSVVVYGKVPLPEEREPAAGADEPTVSRAETQGCQYPKTKKQDSRLRKLHNFCANVAQIYFYRNHRTVLRSDARRQMGVINLCEDAIFAERFGYIGQLL